MKYIVLSLSLFLTCLISSFIIIREDGKKEDYAKLGREVQFDCVGKIKKNDHLVGSCILIGPNELITVAHNFESGGKINDASLYTVELGGKSYHIQQILVHPSYTRGKADIALALLTTAVTGVSPSPVSSTLNELNTRIVGVGYGGFGTARQNGAPSSSAERLAGENMVDSIGGFQLDGIPTMMYCDFDCPTDASCNKMGDATPLPLEYCISGGDSGGGVFRFNKDKWELAGLSNRMSINIEQMQKTGYYGNIMELTRVAVYKKWIDQAFK